MASLDDVWISQSVVRTVWKVNEVYCLLASGKPPMNGEMNIFWRFRVNLAVKAMLRKNVLEVRMLRTESAIGTKSKFIEVNMKWSMNYAETSKEHEVITTLEEWTRKYCCWFSVKGWITVNGGWRLGLKCLHWTETMHKGLEGWPKVWAANNGGERRILKKGKIITCHVRKNNSSDEMMEWESWQRINWRLNNSLV